MTIDTHCKFRQEGGNCAILETASQLLSKSVEGFPRCRNPRIKEQKCVIANDWKSTDLLHLQQPPSDNWMTAPMGDID
ncbi:MAG: hypothetical protein ACD_19C00429G0067 [uncultured bacterium]|nr:MAG: hypothetical protein ACD_19C00429G0067 [uncultured bacterium]